MRKHFFSVLLLLALWGCGGIPKKAEDNYKTGRKNYQSKNYQGAIQALGEAVKEYPEYMDAHLLLGESYRLTSQYSLATPHYKKIVEMDSYNRQALLGLAYCSRKIARFHEGLGYYQQLLKVAQEQGILLKKDEQFEAHFGLAQCYLGFGSPEQALKELDQCSQLNPQHPEVYYYKAVAKEKEGGQFDQAIEYYEKALSVAPNFSLAHRALGYLYFEYYRDDKDWKKKSLNHYKKYIEISKAKDENILAHLDELEEKKPSTGTGTGTGTGTAEPAPKAEALQCPLCGRKYKGKNNACFFDGTPLQRVKP